MSYGSRRERSNVYEKSVIQLFKDNKYEVELMGIEQRWPEHEPYYRYLCEQSDAGAEWALMERYRPDFYCSNGFRDFWVEAKSTNKIELHSFETCQAYDKSKPVYFALPRNHGGIFLCRPSHIVWSLPSRYEAMTVDGHWYYPRKFNPRWTQADYSEFTGSGTPYGIINIGETEKQLDGSPQECRN